MFRVWGCGVRGLSRGCLGVGLYGDNGKENGNCYTLFRVLALGFGGLLFFFGWIFGTVCSGPGVWGLGVGVWDFRVEGF